MKLKELSAWGTDLGVDQPPWLSKNHQDLCIVLSKLMSQELLQRKCDEGKDNGNGTSEGSSVTFKISVNALLQIAEDVLGIPQLIVQNDLSSPSNVQLALLTYFLCMKYSLPGIDTKAIHDTVAPNLIYESLPETTLPNCESCGLHAFLIERIVANKKVYHRRCFVCFQCNNQLYRGSYRLNENGTVECVHHFSSNILAKLPPKKPDENAGANDANPFAADDESFAKGLLLPNSGTPVKSRVPPPRPPPPRNADRVSQIIQKQMQQQLKISVDEPLTNGGSGDTLTANGSSKDRPVSNASSEGKPTPPPRNIPSVSPSVPKKGDVDYPDSLNPFDSDDESSSTDSDYDASLNPFADDEATVKKEVQIEITEPVADVAEKPVASPPPKPPRASFIQSSPRMVRDSPSSHVMTLPRAKKTYHAPPPPMVVRRKIEFTERKSYDSIAEVAADLNRLHVEHEKLESEGRIIEKEIIAILAKGSIEWKKNKFVEEWISITEQKCQIIRKEAVLIHNWLEKYLNAVHADTEYRLRIAVESAEDGKEKSQEECDLIEVLVDIMKLKNGIIESGYDNNPFRDGNESTPKSHHSKIKSLKKRLKKLKKKDK